MPRWRVDIIRKRAEHLGTVEAPNARRLFLRRLSALIRVSGRIESRSRR